MALERPVLALMALGPLAQRAMVAQEQLAVVLAALALHQAPVAPAQALQAAVVAAAAMAAVSVAAR